jgi:hypothetical protein
MSVLRKRVYFYGGVLLLAGMNEGLGDYLGPQLQGLLRVLLLLVLSVSTLWLVVQQYVAERRMTPDERAKRKAEKQELLRATAEKIVTDLKAKGR